MGDMVIREEFALTPEQVARTIALMRQISERIPAMVAGLGALSSAAAGAAAALAAFGEAYVVVSPGPGYSGTPLTVPDQLPANPIGEPHGPCMPQCLLTFPHISRCAA